MALQIHENCIGCGACRRVCPVSAVSGVPGERHEVDIKLCIECCSCGRVCPAGAVTDFFNCTIEQLPRSEWEKPVIVHERCTGCGSCAEVCPAGVLEMTDREGRRTASPERLSLCVSCRWCEQYCMFSAVYLMKHEGGASAAGEGRKT